MGEKTPWSSYREEREARLLKAFDTNAEELPPPPYHVRDVSMTYLLCRFDPVAARRVLPPGLDLCDPCLGVIGLHTTTGGWALGPFGVSFCTIQIKGHDSPDGLPANYIHTSEVSPAAWGIFHQRYNDRVGNGDTVLINEGDRFISQTGPAGKPYLKVRARRTDRVGPEVAGLNNYAGIQGTVPTIYSVAYNAQFQDIEDIEIEITADAPEELQALRPLEIIMPLQIEGMAMTYSAPRLLTDLTPVVPLDTLRATVFDMLSVMGRPAAIITQSGRVAHANALARSLVEGDGRRTLASPGWARRSADQLEHDLDRSGVKPIPVDLPDGRRIFVQLLPMHAAVAGEPSVLVLVTDPDKPDTRDPASLLLMLGLTPAEARLAARVGRGLSPAAAGAELGITQHTARATLKLVFEKLGIARQSQLAQVVTRLQML